MYITKTDLTKQIHGEILDVISRDDENVNTAIQEAMAEAAAYITARYNIEEEYHRTGNNRNPLVVKMVRAIALYNCYNIANPSSIPDSRVLEYENTIKTLRDIQQERASIDGLARRTDDVNGGSSYIRFGGNKPRSNHF